MDADRILAFRLERSGLAVRRARTLADAAACPASDFARDAALLALGARADDVSREGYDRAVDAGDLVVAHVLRGAIHALAPADLALYGSALVAREDAELGAQLGRQVQRLAAEKGFSPRAALEEVAAATGDALAGDRWLGKDELHEELRRRVSADLMPWCRGCGSHHVAPMLWRYATVEATVRLDSKRRYGLATPRSASAAREAVRRFLSFYGPATRSELAEWAGLATPHAWRLWHEAERDLVAVRVGRSEARLGVTTRPRSTRRRRRTASGSSRPGDPFLQKPNRALLAPDPELRKRLFRPVASPGAVLRDGRLAGLWRVSTLGRRAEVTVEPLRRLPRDRLEEEAQRVAELRGAAEAAVVLA